jgi:hypothetical protein
MSLPRSFGRLPDSFLLGFELGAEPSDLVAQDLFQLLPVFRFLGGGNLRF